jgi:Carbamoyl-phosphate synthase L chain, ATP binding domain
MTTVLALVDTDYADTPYDRWIADSDIEMHMLVSGQKFGQYRHIPGARSFPEYYTGGSVEQAALELAERIKPDAVVSRMEGDVLRAARLRELLGIGGQDFASALAFRDKVLMKNLAREAGLDVPEFTPVRVAFDLFGFARDHGYPIVVKPAYGSGSLGTRVLRGPDDLTALLGEGLPEYPEVERFVEGSMYVVDGLVAGGEVVAAFVSCYLNHCLSFRSGIFLGAVQLAFSDPLVLRLARYARRVLACLPTPECTTFHIEVFHTPDDELVLCEVASRTGGALTTAAVRAATGFDLDHEWFRAQVGKPPLAGPVHGATPGHTAGWVLFYPEVGTLRALPPGPPPSFVVEARTRATVGDTYRGAQKSGMYCSAYVVTGRDDAEVARNADELARWYADGVRWEK